MSKTGTALAVPVFYCDNITENRFHLLYAIEKERSE